MKQIDNDKLNERLTDVETWRERIDKELESAAEQRKKLFSLVDQHTKASQKSREEMHKKLDEQSEQMTNGFKAMLERLDAAEKKETEHDEAITKAEKEREELRLEELRLKTLVAEATDEHLKAKGLPASGKKLYGCMATMVAIGTVLGPFVLEVLEHLPRLIEAIRRIL